jgi:hypothetical protein
MNDLVNGVEPALTIGLGLAIGVEPGVVEQVEQLVIRPYWK